MFTNFFKSWELIEKRSCYEVFGGRGQMVWSLSTNRLGEEYLHFHSFKISIGSLQHRAMSIWREFFKTYFSTTLHQTEAAQEPCWARDERPTQM